MNITPEEAQSALNDIQHMTIKARQLGHISAYYMLLWGAIWVIGFLLCQFFTQWIIWTWIAMIIIGMTGSGILGSKQGQTARLIPGSREAFISVRVGIFQGVLYGFAIFWLLIFHLTPLQIGMLWITIFTFGSIISGLWFQQSLPIISGIGITLLSVPGYYLLPHYFWLWAAVFAGLPLIGIGLYLMRRC